MRVRVSKSLWKYALAVPLLVGSGVLVHAQIEGPKRGIPPIASNGDFACEVSRRCELQSDSKPDESGECLVQFHNF